MNERYETTIPSGSDNSANEEAWQAIGQVGELEYADFRGPFL